MKPTPRILSLDGGGSWALIQAHVLMDFYGADTPGLTILDKFDLVAANSGGSIVLAGLACDYTPGQIAAFFENQANREGIFRPLAIEPLRRLLPLPKYRTDGKYNGLYNVLGAGVMKTLPEWKAQRRTAPDLLITAFDYDLSRAAFFRTNTESMAGSQTAAAPPTATILDAIHASSDAPVLYFNRPTQITLPSGERRYWDGGVAGYNNPVLAAVVEARANGTPLEEIRVVSIGTGTVRKQRRESSNDLGDAYAGGESPGILKDFEKLASAILDDPPDAASFTSHVMLGGRLPGANEVVEDGPVVRLSPSIQPALLPDGRHWDWPKGVFDKPDAWGHLASLQMDAIKAEDVSAIIELCAKWMKGLVPNQPIRSSAQLKAEIGHDRYSDAKRCAAWALNRP